MENDERIEQIQRKIILEDKLQHAQKTSAAKTVFAAVGGAVVGGVALIANYFQAAGREIWAYAKEVGPKRGVSPERIIQDPRMRAELQQLILKKGHVERLHRNILPAAIGGAVVGGFVMHYFSHKKQDRLKGEIQSLSEKMTEERKAASKGADAEVQR